MGDIIQVIEKTIALDNLVPRKVQYNFSSSSYNE